VPKDQGFTRAKAGGMRVSGCAAPLCVSGRAALRGSCPALRMLSPAPSPLPCPCLQVLLLLPQRNLALRVVSRLCQLAVRETRTDTIQNRQRLLEEFGDGGGAGGGSWAWALSRLCQVQQGERQPQLTAVYLPACNRPPGLCCTPRAGEPLSEREAAAVARKPAEHQALFSGNMDDHFRLGIKLTRCVGACCVCPWGRGARQRGQEAVVFARPCLCASNFCAHASEPQREAPFSAPRPLCTRPPRPLLSRGAVKLFADFFDSDIVVASPLALATKMAGGLRAGASIPWLVRGWLPACRGGPPCADAALVQKRAARRRAPPTFCLRWRWWWWSVPMCC
jgi:hypothetical protein